MLLGLGVPLNSGPARPVPSLRRAAARPSRSGAAREADLKQARAILPALDPADGPT